MFKLSKEGIIVVFLGTCVCWLANTLASMPLESESHRPSVLIYVVKDECDLQSRRSLRRDECVLASYGISDTKIIRHGKKFEVGINNSIYAALTHHRFRFESSSHATIAARMLSGTRRHIVALHRKSAAQTEPLSARSVMVLNEFTGVYGPLSKVNERRSVVD